MIYEISIVKNGQKCGAIMMNNDHFQLNSSEIINASHAAAQSAYLYHKVFLHFGQNHLLRPDRLLMMSVVSSAKINPYAHFFFHFDN